MNQPNQSEQTKELLKCPKCGIVTYTWDFNNHHNYKCTSEPLTKPATVRQFQYVPVSTAKYEQYIRIASELNTSWWDYVITNNYK